MSKLNRRGELQTFDVYNRFKRISQDVSTIPLKAYKYVYKRFNALCAKSIETIAPGHQESEPVIISMLHNSITATFTYIM